MSANNVLTINKKTFLVKHCDVDTGAVLETWQAKSLEEAIDIAQKFMQEEEVEYGIHIHE